MVGKRPFLTTISKLFLLFLFFFPPPLIKFSYLITRQAEVIFLGQLKHAHLVNLIGYCCEDEQRVLVYEYMTRGNLENHLFKGNWACFSRVIFIFRLIKELI